MNSNKHQKHLQVDEALDQVLIAMLKMKDYKAEAVNLEDASESTQSLVFISQPILLLLDGFRMICAEDHCKPAHPQAVN